jgi:hypothetical protein
MYQFGMIMKPDLFNIRNQGEAAMKAMKYSFVMVGFGGLVLVNILIISF